MTDTIENAKEEFVKLHSSCGLEITHLVIDDRIQNDIENVSFWKKVKEFAKAEKSEIRTTESK